MFIMWGNEWDYEVKKDGLSIYKPCPNCHLIRKLVEVIPTSYFTIFFVRVSATERKNSVLECTSCRERFYIQPDDYHATKSPPPEYTEQLKKFSAYANRDEAVSAWRADPSDNRTWGQVVADWERATGRR